MWMTLKYATILALQGKSTSYMQYTGFWVTLHQTVSQHCPPFILFCCVKQKVYGYKSIFQSLLEDLANLEKKMGCLQSNWEHFLREQYNVLLQIILLPIRLVAL